VYVRDKKHAAIREIHGFFVSILIIKNTQTTEPASRIASIKLMLKAGDSKGRSEKILARIEKRGYQLG